MKLVVVERTDVSVDVVVAWRAEAKRQKINSGTPSILFGNRRHDTAARKCTVRNHD
jgi:hypothetical protein